MRANTVEAAGLGSSTSGLTVAERRVAAIAASGLSNAEIASVLAVSLNTVKTHLRRVYSKLDVKRQSELVLRLNRGMDVVEVSAPVASTVASE
jgi:DNA-binding CsgD family transcriptional regulator